MYVKYLHNAWQIVLTKWSLALPLTTLASLKCSSTQATDASFFSARVQLSDTWSKPRVNKDVEMAQSIFLRVPSWSTVISYTRE